MKGRLIMRKTLCLGLWIGCLGLLFSQAGCRTVPRWDWWKVGNRGPSDSSALARSATELPSTIASRSGGAGKRSGDIAPPFNPNAEMLADTTPSMDGPASDKTHPSSSDSLAAASPIDMTPQQGPYDTNRFADSAANNTPAANVAELPQYNAIENSAGANRLASVPNIPAVVPSNNSSPKNTALAGNTNGSNAAIPSTGLPAYGIDKINQLRQAPANLASATHGVQAELAEAANTAGDKLANAGAAARNSIESAATNVAQVATRATNNVAEGVRVATATPPAYRPGGTGNYSSSVPAVFNIATRPSGAAAPASSGIRK